MLLTLLLDENTAPARVETVATSAGAYVLTLSSTLADLGVELHSTFVGHAGTTTRAVHLELAPGIARTVPREHHEHSLPVWAARRRCLAEHAQQLIELLTELGHAVSVEITDDQVVALERA